MYGKAATGGSLGGLGALIGGATIATGGAALAVCMIGGAVVGGVFGGS
jgi:hypothetical protein